MTDPAPGVQVLFTGEVELSADKILNRTQLQRLIRELQEADWNSRGYESHDPIAGEVLADDMIELFGEKIKIQNTMLERGDQGDLVCLQWFDEGEYCEITVPWDFECRVWRPIV